MKFQPLTKFDWLLIVVIAFALFCDKLPSVSKTQPIVAVTIEESGKSTAATMAQAEALNSPVVRSYMASKGYAMYHRIDPNITGAGDAKDTGAVGNAPPPPEIATAVNAANGVENPVLVVMARDSLKVLHVGHVATIDDVLSVLKKYGGE